MESRTAMPIRRSVEAQTSPLLTSDDYRNPMTAKAIPNALPYIWGVG